MRRLEVLVQLLLASVAVVLVASVVYVGSWRWAAPVVCPDHQPDGIVVTMSVEGVLPRYSLHCMGARGDYSQVGAWQPMAALLVMLYAPAVAVTLLWWRLMPGE